MEITLLNAETLDKMSADQLIRQMQDHADALSMARDYDHDADFIYLLMDISAITMRLTYIYGIKVAARPYLKAEVDL